MSTGGATSAMVLGDPALPLLSPQPMVLRSGSRAAPEAAVPAAAPDDAALPPSPATQPSRPTAPVTRRTGQTEQAIAHHPADRPGFVLNDAQIASIKQRLRLTPDQEAMWPAVEAALRNVAYARARNAHRPDTPAPATQLALADPDSVEVQGLKSAAIPLLMSFSAEQKNEVRNLAHVMGLDRLAAEM
ncbi:MAG TPA: hypothetical protein VK442_05395 [Xanthobacteraceae bacterium]|nr:hypothetical protein [Xanthobacteraceae bacterium]